MSDAAGHAAALGVVLLALGAAWTPDVVAVGEPWLEEVPDGAWTPREAVALEPEGERARISSAGCAAEVRCRGVVARAVELQAGTYLVRAEVERLTAGAGSRLFLSTPEPRWTAVRGPTEIGRPRVVELVARDVGAGPAELGVVVRAGEVVRVGEVELRAGRATLLHLGCWWGAVLAAAAGAVVVLERARRASRGWPILALGAALVAGVAAPRERLDDVLLLVPGTTPADLQGSLLSDPTPLVLLQKLGGHALGFALLGAFGRWTGAAPPALLARLTSFAAATEALQLLIPDRSGRLADVGLDLAGGLAGLALVELSLRVAALRAPRASAASRP